MNKIDDLSMKCAMGFIQELQNSNEDLSTAEILTILSCMVIELIMAFPKIGGKKLLKKFLSVLGENIEKYIENDEKDGANE